MKSQGHGCLKGFCCILLASSIRLVPCVSCAGDIQSFAGFKGNAYQQWPNPTASPAPSGNGSHVFQSPVRGSNLLSASVQTPTSSFNLASLGFGLGYFAQDGLISLLIFDSPSGLDSVAGSGSFAFTMRSSQDGVQTASLELGNNQPPATVPRLGMFPGFQYFTGVGFQWAVASPYYATNDLEITWNEFADRRPGDYIQLALAQFAPDGVRTFLLTPEYGQPGVIDASATSYVIPAGVLPANNQRFIGYLRFLRLVDTDTTSIPGAQGYSACFNETEFYFKTGDSWYGEPFPDTNPPGLIRLIPAVGQTMNRLTRELYFEFTEPIVADPVVSLSHGLVLENQGWTSWEQLALRCRLPASYPYDTEITWTLEGMTDMAGNALPAALATGSFFTPPAPVYEWYQPYYLAPGYLGCDLRVLYSQVVVIEASSDLKTWSPIATNQVEHGGTAIQFDTTKEKALYFRARE